MKLIDSCLFYNPAINIIKNALYIEVIETLADLIGFGGENKKVLMPDFKRMQHKMMENGSIEVLFMTEGFYPDELKHSIVAIRELIK